MKTSIVVSSFGGINKLHTRETGQASEGKNFWTRNGVLVTREGCRLLSNTPTFSSIETLHQAAIAQVYPSLLVEDQLKLYVYNGSEWYTLLDGVDGNGFSSVMYYDYLILVNGKQKYCYEPGATYFTPLENTEGSEVPDMEYITVHKDILFGWSPHFYPTDTIYFNGYETDESGKILSRSGDSWPADFAIRVPDGSGSSVIACVSAGTHLLILTEKSYWLLYGDNEDNFSLVPGGSIGIYRERTMAKVGDYVFWLSRDEYGVKKIYAYSGTQPYIISQPVEELINNLPANYFVNAKAYGFGSKFWLVLPNIQENKTKAFVFDTDEKQWFMHEFPKAFRAACLYDEKIHFGTHDGKIVVMDEECTDDFGNPILTEFKIGPLNTGDGRKFKIKRVWINAETRNNFGLKLYFSSDAFEDEKGPYEVVTSANKVGQKTYSVKPKEGHKGRDIYIRVETQDIIDELQELSLTIIPKELK